LHTFSVCTLLGIFGIDLIFYFAFIKNILYITIFYILLAVNPLLEMSRFVRVSVYLVFLYWYLVFFISNEVSNDGSPDAKKKVDIRAIVDEPVAVCIT